jgi:hypothetical protein
MKMLNVKNILNSVLILGFVLAAPSLLRAQTAEPPRVFVSVNGGGQSQERTISTSLTFPLHGETASVGAAQNVGRGAIFDLSAGYRLRNLGAAWSSLGIGVGFTTYSKTGDLLGAASIPHPLVSNSPASVDINERAKRSERSVYIQAVWFMPLGDISPRLNKFELAFSVGPSFITVEQDVLVNVTVPSDTQNANAVIESREDSKTGIIAGVDGNYFVTPNVGIGAFIRYQGAGSVDLSPAAEESTGGFQGGGGLRLRF